MDKIKDNLHYLEEVANELPLDACSDMYLREFNNRFIARIFIDRINIFNKAYKLLTKRKHFSRRNAFGEMHGDRYLWIEKCEHAKIIVEEGQSYKFIFILNENQYFHIRELAYKWNYPPSRRSELKQCTLKKFKETNFKTCKENPAFNYGDCRDEGYCGSLDYGLRGFEKVDKADQECLSAIKCLDFWVIYLDDPSQLE